jgi:hypothetical protein
MRAMRPESSARTMLAREVHASAWSTSWEDVALERVSGLELAGRGFPEPLGGGPVGLDLGHD